MCDYPNYEGNTYNHILDYTFGLQNIIIRCGKRDKALLEWYAEDNKQ